jgi:dolichol-phosphate mannosyltransferase
MVTQDKIAPGVSPVTAAWVGGRVSGDRPLISVVAPVFNERELIDAFCQRTSAAMQAIEGMDYELVLVDDRSTDGSWERMYEIAAADPRVVLVRLARNFGHQIAITAGVDVARGDAVVVIDADLQDPPEVIVRMVARWQEGYDVVYGVRSARSGETAAKLWTASLFYRILRRFTNIDIPVDVGDFRLLSRRAADQLRQLREKDRFVRGLVSWMGYSQIGVEYEREERAAGETKYPWSKMIRFAADGITSFSTVPLRLATWMGYLASGFAFLYMLSVFVQKWMGYTIEGWATIMVAMLFVGGVQLICLGIMGEYIGRIFNEVKPRPVYVLEDLVRASDESEKRTGRDS